MLFSSFVWALLHKRLRGEGIIQLMRQPQNIQTAQPVDICTTRLSIHHIHASVHHSIYNVEGRSFASLRGVPGPDNWHQPEEEQHGKW